MINNKAGNNILQELVVRHPGLIQLVYIAQIFLEYISFHSFLLQFLVNKELYGIIENEY